MFPCQGENAVLREKLYPGGLVSPAMRGLLEWKDGRQRRRALPQPPPGCGRLSRAAGMETDCLGSEGFG